MAIPASADLPCPRSVFHSRKYLLKSAVLRNEHLKEIDVLCWDTNGSVKARYDEFVKFNYYRFRHCDVVDYLNALMDNTKRGKGRQTSPDEQLLRFDKLEATHEQFMKTQPQQ